MSYGLAAIRLAFEGYLAGMDGPKIVKELRRTGYASFSEKTFNMWRTRYGWRDVRDRMFAVRVEMMTQGKGLRLEVLRSLLALRKTFTDKLDSQTENGAGKKEPKPALTIQEAQLLVTINQHIIDLSDERPIRIGEMNLSPAQVRRIFDAVIDVCGEHPLVGPAMKVSRDELYDLFELKHEEAA